MMENLNAVFLQRQKPIIFWLQRHKYNINPRCPSINYSIVRSSIATDRSNESKRLLVFAQHYMTDRRSGRWLAMLGRRCYLWRNLSWCRRRLRTCRRNTAETCCGRGSGRLCCSASTSLPSLSTPLDHPSSTLSTSNIALLGTGY